MIASLTIYAQQMFESSGDENLTREMKFEEKNKITGHRKNLSSRAQDKSVCTRSLS